MIKKILFLCVLMFFGCATFNDLRLSNEFEMVAESYKSAINLEDFEMAGSFMSKQYQPKDSALADKNFLKKIKVTSYKVLSGQMDTEKSMVEQTVKINYYHTDYLIEKVVGDNQIWIYESDSWRLSTGLPVFE